MSSFIIFARSNNYKTFTLMYRQKKHVILLVFGMFLSTLSFAQKDDEQPKESYWGMRFATDMNYFHTAERHDLVDGWFSSWIMGAFFRQYGTYSGFELGLNWNYKANEQSRFILPGVMQDFHADQMTAMNTVEAQFMVGPHIGYFHPKIGYIFTYRFSTEGFLTAAAPDSQEINVTSFSMPIGLSVDLPTGYGEVGIGAFYEIGIPNVKKADSDVFPSVYDGGRMRALNFEITTTFGIRK